MLDIGDIISVEGHVFKTHTGEVTIKVNKLTLLSKSYVHCQKMAWFKGYKNFVTVNVMLI